MIDQEISEWGHVEEDAKKAREVAPKLKQMLGMAVADPATADRVSARLAKHLVASGQKIDSEKALQYAVFKAAERAAALNLGNIHPVLRAYAYSQAVKGGGGG